MTHMSILSILVSKEASALSISEYINNITLWKHCYDVKTLLKIKHISYNPCAFLAMFFVIQKKSSLLRIIDYCIYMKYS